MNNLEKLFSVLSPDERELAASAATSDKERRIVEVKELNQGEFFSLITEIVMRRLETAYNFWKGDTEYTLSLIEKNLKFHKYHKTNIRKPQLIEFYNIARAMTIAKETGAPLKAMTIKKINNMRNEEVLIWRTLMEMQKSLG